MNSQDLNASNKPLNVQIESLVKILEHSKNLTEALQKIPKLKLPNWYLGAGCINQTVWNYLLGKELDFGISDYDLIYFDDQDLSWEAEDFYIQKGNKLFKDFPIEIQIRNQARVHLWYEQKFGKKIRVAIPAADPPDNITHAFPRPVCAAMCLVGISMTETLSRYRRQWFADAASALLS